MRNPSVAFVCVRGCVSFAPCRHDTPLPLGCAPRHALSLPRQTRPLGRNSPPGAFRLRSRRGAHVVDDARRARAVGRESTRRAQLAVPQPGYRERLVEPESGRCLFPARANVRRRSPWRLQRPLRYSESTNSRTCRHTPSTQKKKQKKQRMKLRATKNHTHEAADLRRAYFFASGAVRPYRRRGGPRRIVQHSARLTLTADLGCQTSTERYALVGAKHGPAAYEADCGAAVDDTATEGSPTSHCHRRLVR